MFPKLQFNKINPIKFAVAYKLLHDILLVLIIFFIGAMITEGLLPGIISAHIKLYKILFAVLLNILAINFISMKAGLNPGKFSNKKTAIALLFILAALLFNSMLRINLALNLFILLVAAFVFYFLYKVLFLEKH
jgi:hypothetical protein